MEGEGLSRVEHVERVERVEVGWFKALRIFNAEAQSWRGMVFNRVGHVDHVEDLKMGIKPQSAQRTQR